MLLWALKPAEEGIDKGVIVRLWNVSDEAANTAIKLQPGIAAARRTTHIQTEIDPVPLDDDGRVTATFARQQIQTVRLKVPPAATE